MDTTTFIFYFFYLFMTVGFFITFTKFTNMSLEDDDVEKEEEKEKYEEKYLKKYRNMEIVDLSKERLDGLKNTIIFENTPLGNVLMFYDNSRGSFAYYSDNTIPYRFLEVVGRKYVVMNNCKDIFVDMEVEIKEATRKMDEKKEKLAIEELNKPEVKSVKNVFAKFKNYNKDGIKAAAVPIDTKARPPTAKKTDTSDKIVKEKANRYSSEGKLANYSFLKKVDRKIVDKKYAMNFAEFKKSMVSKI